MSRPAAFLVLLLLPSVAAFQMHALSLRGPTALLARKSGARRAMPAARVSSPSMQQEPGRESGGSKGIDLSSLSSDVTSTSAAASFNLAKAIVGAGSFSLPFCLKNQGILGGLGTIVACAFLASYTMQSMIESKNQVELRTGLSRLSYVDMTRMTLGEGGARVVFSLTAMASLLVCASYLAFIGSTLSTMAAQPGTWLHELAPDASKLLFEEAAVLLLLPICFLRDFRFLSFTSVLGIISVGGACMTVVIDGLNSQGSLDASMTALTKLPLWPHSISSYFESFGSVVFLFCVNFLIFPIERTLAKSSEWPVTVQRAVTATAVGNFLFAALGYSFFGSDTQEIVLNNLGPGSILSSVKVLLCIDLLFSYPLVLAAGTDIIETAVLSQGSSSEKSLEASTSAEYDQRTLMPTDASVFVGTEQLALRTGLIGLTFAIGQAKGFNIITNVAGGFAQGTLALIVPGALVLHLKGDSISAPEAFAIKALMSFGFFSAAITTYLALSSA